MAHITGQWLQGTGRKVWKNLSLSIEKYSQQTAQDIVENAEGYLDNWEDDLNDVLGDQLAKSEWHKLRDPSRPFPYRNTGNLLNSISHGASYRATGAGNYAIKSWAEIGVPYAHFTSLGYRKRADGQSPNWMGWMDRVFSRTGGQFFSVADIFDRLVLERQGARHW